MRIVHKRLVLGTSIVAVGVLGTWATLRWIDSRRLAECRAALRQENFGLAAVLAEQRLAQEPNDQEAMLYAARAQARLGNWARSEGYFAQVPLREADDFRLRGRGLESRRLFDEAARVYEQVLHRWPDDGEALTHLAAIRSQQDRDDEALVLARRLTKMPSHQVAGFVMCGILEHHRRNHAQAADDFQSALRISPNLDGTQQTALVLSFLAEDLVWLGKGREAEQYAIRAMELTTGPEPCWSLGRARQTLGDEAGAMAAWQEALARDPNHVLTLQDLGHLHLQCRELSRALRCFERAHELMPDDEAIKYALETARRHVEFEKDGGQKEGPPPTGLGSAIQPKESKAREP